MARWMDPQTGTFLSVDPVVGDYTDPQSYNAYSYARNNPISLNDPTGMCPLFGCVTQIPVNGQTYTVTITPLPAVNISPPSITAPTVTVAGPGIGAFGPSIGSGIGSIGAGGGGGGVPSPPTTGGNGGGGSTPAPSGPGPHGPASDPSPLDEGSIVPIINPLEVYAVGRAAYSGLRYGIPALLRALGKGGTGVSDDAARIARGHAWQRHSDEFSEFRDADEFAEHIDSVMRSPTAQRALSRGRHAFVDQRSRTIVIRDPKNPDGGTAFRARNPLKRFDRLR